MYIHVDIIRSIYLYSRLIITSCRICPELLKNIICIALLHRLHPPNLYYYVTTFLFLHDRKLQHYFNLVF